MRVPQNANTMKKISQGILTMKKNVYVAVLIYVKMLMMMELQPRNVPYIYILSHG